MFRFVSVLAVLMVVLSTGCCKIIERTEVRYVDRPAPMMRPIPTAPAVYASPQQPQQIMVQPSPAPMQTMAQSSFPPDGPVAADGTFCHTRNVLVQGASVPKQMTYAAVNTQVGVKGYIGVDSPNAHIHPDEHWERIKVGDGFQGWTLIWAVFKN
jgi:hypothetical protein